MKFPWHKYEEIKANRSNTLQVFITNICTMKCKGCFARNIMEDDVDVIPIDEYRAVIDSLLMKGGEKVNLLGGEPTLHPYLKDIIEINRHNDLRTTIYTNGGHMVTWQDDYLRECFEDVTMRLSLYSRSGPIKSLKSIKKFGEKGVPLNLEICFMVSADTTAEEVLLTAIEVERDFNCKVFFISSIRELDNPRKEFFDDTSYTMPVMKYKELVHTFLTDYEGDMEIHVSKRGVFESTTSVAERKCRFANYVIGGKIVQCPYDLVNLKFQKDYEFNKRDCQHNNSCLMSKVIYKRKNG